MKLLLLLFSISFTSAFAQRAVVANEKMNIVYYGVNNRLSVAVAGYPCQSVVLTTESGRIEKKGCSEFDYTPNFIGAVELKVWVKNKAGKKLIDRIPYRVKRLPDPIVFIGPLTSFLDPYHSRDTISIRNLYEPKILRAFLIDSDYEEDFKIISYSVSVLRDNKEIFSLLNEGAAYSDSLKLEFNNVKIGDVLSITNIKCLGSDQLERTLAPMNLFIAD